MRFLVCCFFSHYSDDNDDGFKGPLLSLLLRSRSKTFPFYKMLLERVFCIASRIGDHVILLESSFTQINVLLRVVYKLICKLS